MKARIWFGESRRLYEYDVFPIGTTFKAVPGNYIFVRETARGIYSPIYIGETEYLFEGFDNHHRMSCIRREEATHIHVRRNEDGVMARRREKRDLLTNLIPVPTCNE